MGGEDFVIGCQNPRIILKGGSAGSGSSGEKNSVGCGLASYLGTKPGGPAEVSQF